ncbi:hypothetical protein RRG08_010232 [Elysia crispata]|uniref:Uncharacterized protein n=1 Tax=Elysia crispata TaxID=231223 RepID=A0AAE0Z0V5_9GAST|nr:hypothetical protein RRG08_010232 [Elysia crispata]
MPVHILDGFSNLRIFEVVLVLRLKTFFIGGGAQGCDTCSAGQQETTLEQCENPSMSTTMRRPGNARQF